MRKITLIFIITAIVFLLLACDPGAVPGPFESPSPVPAGTPYETETPDEPLIPEPVVSSDGTYTVETHLLCFPDGSDISNAEHVLIYALPVFSEQNDAADAFNANVALYEEELIARITEQPGEGSGEQLTTYVNVEVTKVTDYTNIIFTEETRKGAQTLHHKYALVLSPDGDEMSLAKITGIYDADVLVAQLIWNRMNAFGGITRDTVLQALDIYNGFYLTETGYAVFFDPGVLYEAGEGFKVFELSETEIYPSFVGDVLSVESYRELLPVFSRLAAATLVNFESFDTVPSPFVSAVFIADTLSEDAGPSKYGTRLQLTREDMDELFRSYFSAGQFPGADSAVPSVKEENGLYTVELSEVSHPFSIEFTDAKRENNTVVLTGNIMFGTPGTQDARFVSGIIITLAQAQHAAAGGYIIQSWMITK
ncbi:MAG: hypothetical protein BWY11_01072 [Firmicutes bacterium ADurb.Bin182]|nr:MAG: hypothetical protein BWY11_01072 [Firmicutes bacterium ADurb.Bin182]